MNLTSIPFTKLLLALLSISMVSAKASALDIELPINASFFASAEECKTVDVDGSTSDYLAGEGLTVRKEDFAKQNPIELIEEVKGGTLKVSANLYEYLGVDRMIISASFQPTSGKKVELELNGKFGELSRAQTGSCNEESDEGTIVLKAIANVRK